MSAPLRMAAHLAAAVLTLSVLLLGAWWRADRAHGWERPEWRHRTFVRLRGEAGAPSPIWVMAVNPRCPHCLVALTRLHTEWERCGRQQDLVSLIVDSPVRPDARAIAAVPTPEVWWDRDGIWRRRWGHRLYGELMQFDRSGRFVQSLPTFGTRDLPSPCAIAPATHRGGGL